MRLHCVSKKLTASGVVTAVGKGGWLCGFTLVAGTTLSSLKLCNGGTSGTELAGAGLVQSTGQVAGEQSHSITYPHPISFDVDIYANIAGTGAYAYVQFMQKE
jgi:hypothetical protein